MAQETVSPAAATETIEIVPDSATNAASSATASASGAREVPPAITTEAASTRAAGAGEVILQTRNLNKTYRPMFARVGKTALHDLTIDVRRGEIFGLVGPNGSGKTTTLKLLLGLIKATKGDIEIFGRGPRDVAVKRRIGFLPDGPYFYDHLNSAEVLDFYGQLFGFDKAERARRIPELLDMVGLNPADRGRAIRTYSKGMVQRVGLAQALINDPELLFLDEPTTGLDPIGARAMKDAILNVRAQGKTVLLCSHLLADVQAICDRVAILSEGRLVKFGTVPELVGPSQEFDIYAAGLGDVAVKEASTRGYEVDRAVADDDRSVGITLDQQHREALRFRADSSEKLDEILTFIRDSGGRTIDVKGRSETLEDVFVRSVKSDGR